MEKSLLDHLDATMCEADALYAAMNESLLAENPGCVCAYSKRLIETAAVCGALLDRMNGATVH